MRLVGIALFTAWLLAWAVAPKGEPARATSTVGGLAIAGSDEVAVAWLEVAHARPRSSEVLHVATVAPGADGKVTQHLHLDGHDDVAYRVAEAGPGRYYLVSERRTRMDRWFEVRSFGRAFPDRLPDLRATFNASSWEVVAAGERLVLAEEEPSGETAIHVFDPRGEWLAPQRPVAAGRTLLGSGHGTLVRYEVGRRDDLVEVAADSGAWTMRVSHPRCVLPSTLTGVVQPTQATPGQPQAGAAPGATVIQRAVPADAREKVVSVVGLPGGYARMARLGRYLCVDGMRDGAWFKIDPVELGEVVDPRLGTDASARLYLTDHNDGKGALYLRQLEGLTAGQSPFGWSQRPLTLAGGDGVRGYGIFHVTPTGGGAALITRATGGQTQVLLQRYTPGAPAPLSVKPSPGEILLGPPRHFLPDHRPLLRALVVVPLVVLGLGLFASVKLWQRLRAVLPRTSSAPLSDGPVAIEASLALDADAPAGALRLRRGSQPLLLFIDGAEVLRASDVRPRSEPRGDAVDVASGAPVVATGRMERGSVFRGEDTLHAGPGDLVLVGCSLAEARARVTVRLAVSSALVLGALTAALALAR